MYVEVVTKNGLSNISIIASSEKDLAILTDVFNRSSLNRAFRFKARPDSMAVRDGVVSSVTLNNDAFITTKYMKSIGFTVLKNKYYGYYFYNNRFMLYRRANSNVYTLYTNAKIATNTQGDYILVQKVEDDTLPVVKVAQFRQVSELERYLK